MKRVSTGSAWLLMALLACPLGCSRDDAVKHEPPPVVKGLTLAQVTYIAVPEHVEVSGTVKAKNSIQLAARIAGTITGVYAREGDRVRRGNRLVTLEAMENTAGAAAAQHAVAEALARKKLAEVTFERFSRLFEEQAVTRQELDTRRAERDMADRALARAREAARAAAAVADYTRISAPLAGIVTSRSVDPGSTVFPGMALMTIDGDGGYRLEVAVPESLQGKVAAGATVPVSLDNGTEDAVGRVAEIVPHIDPRSRTFVVKLDIPATGAHSGRFGRARLPVGEKQVLLVPKNAVQQRGQLTYLWVVDQGDIARMRLVKTGAAHADRIEILAGLSAGERIVVDGTGKVSDGTKISEQQE